MFFELGIQTIKNIANTFVDWANIQNKPTEFTPEDHTHEAVDITDFDTEVSNNTDVSANTTHRSSDGTDHTYINQDVTTTADVVFNTLEATELKARAGVGQTTNLQEWENSGGTNLSEIDINGWLGIGVNPNSPLHVKRNTSDTGVIRANYTHLIANPSSSLNVAQGLAGLVVVEGSQSKTSCFGMDFALQQDGSGNVTNFFGARCLATQLSTASGTIADMIGGLFRFRKEGSANITNATAMKADALFVGTGGTITNAYLVEGSIADTGSETVTNFYGMYMPSITKGTNNYAIYTNSGEIRFGDIVNFAGTMGNSTKDPTTDAPVDWIEVQIAGTTRYLPAYAA